MASKKVSEEGESWEHVKWNKKLWFAADRGDNITVEECLSNGADVNYHDGWGDTILHIAAYNGHTDIVKMIISHGADINRTNYNMYKPYDVAKNSQIRELIKCQRMLNRLLGEGSYESYDMRVMVTGQCGVGKTSLVMILLGENVSKIRQSTDGISLLEGRCGLGIEGREWFLIHENDYKALDFVYNKVLMSSEDSGTHVKVPTSQQEYQEKPIHQLEDNAYVQEQQQIEPCQHRKMESKMTKEEIGKKLVQVMKTGTYTMKIGRLVFWDFGGQYVYYTTHQTFMTYRALFLVVFDGSKGLNDEVTDVVCFPGQHGTPTAAVFLQHWVNSILTYCKLTYPGIPKILFVATHKDNVPKELVCEHRKVLYSEIEDLFRHHEGRNHLVLEHQLFVNATDKDDPEITTLKQVITDLTFKHPCWGEKMPNKWVPLELEIAQLAANGTQIVSLHELEDLNEASTVSVLSPKDLKFFLEFQHSLGKIVYFDTPQLRNFVIINPLFMVEVMKSFVTDEQFWPQDSKWRRPFMKMSSYGVIEKKDLFKVWKRPGFSEVLPYKDFIFDMLLHLDILSEQRRYDIRTGTRLHVSEYFVPCMLTKRYTSRYMEKECTPSRAISLAFVFKGTIIPPALPNRLISACLSIWFVREYEGEQLLFSGFVALACDKSHDIVLCVQGNKILVYIIHRSSKGLIVCDIATSVRECIQNSLQRISEFYQSTSSRRSSDINLPFHVELACSNLQCYLPEAEALETKKKLCPVHNTKYEIDVWYQDEKALVAELLKICSYLILMAYLPALMLRNQASMWSVDNCDVFCEGLSSDVFRLTPSDSEILRLTSKLSAESVRELVIQLGIKTVQWDDITLEYPRDMSMVKFLILLKWRDSMNGTFRQLSDKLTKMENSHVLCQVTRIKKQATDIPEIYLDSIPTDEILDALAPEIGVVSFRLGIELGRKIRELEALQYNYKNDLVAQTKQILYSWRNDRSVKPTMGVLQQALVNVGRGAVCLRRIVDDLGVKEI